MVRPLLPQAHREGTAHENRPARASRGSPPRLGRLCRRASASHGAGERRGAARLRPELYDHRPRLPADPGRAARRPRGPRGGRSVRAGRPSALPRVRDGDGPAAELQEGRRPQGVGRPPARAAAGRGGDIRGRVPLRRPDRERRDDAAPPGRGAAEPAARDSADLLVRDEPEARDAGRGIDGRVRRQRRAGGGAALRGARGRRRGIGLRRPSLEDRTAFACAATQWKVGRSSGYDPAVVASMYLPPVSTTWPVTARRISVWVTSCLACRSASAATMANLERGTPSASSPRIAGATLATVALTASEPASS